MPEFNFEDLTKQPQHEQNAESFINSVLNQITSSFPSLEISAVNQTAEDLDSFPGILEAAKLDGDEALKKELAQMDSQTDAESSHSTRVFVNIVGDKENLIEKATKMINKKAKEFSGENTDDSGIGSYGAREALPKIVGYKPEHEDLPLRERYLGYQFSDKLK